MNGGSLRGITWQQDGANINRNPTFMDYLENTFDGNVLALGAESDGGADTAGLQGPLTCLR